MVATRSEQVAAFYARHARKLERAVARQVRDQETASDGCARAWEKLLARPDVELDHRGVKWLETVAVREAWRDAGPGREMERLDAEVVEGETVGDRLVGRDDDAQGRVESAERLALVGELSVDQQRAVVLQAQGFSYEEITGVTGASERKVRRDITRGRSRLAELDRADAGATTERDPVALLAAARERHAALVLERADAPAERHVELDRRLGNVAAATRALCADVVERQVASPPRWATALFGDRPLRPAKAAVYDHGVREAARYRVAFGVREGESRLGATPMRQATRAAFQRAEAAVQATKRELGQSPSPPAGDVGRGAAALAAGRRGQLSLDGLPDRDAGRGR